MMEKGTRVKSTVNAIGKIRHGTVTGNLAGFVLVLWDGLEKDYGYLPGEIVKDDSGE